MFSNSSDRDASGRTDLQESPEGPDAVDVIRALLLVDPSSTPECRLAWVLRNGPIGKLRNLEYESGLGLYQVWEMTSPVEGGTTPLGLVETIERGKSWDSEGREKGSYRLGVSGRFEYTKEYISKYSQTYPSKKSWRVKDLENHRVLETPRYSAEGTQYDPEVWNEDAPLLWPGLDLWTRDQLGGEGWRIAMLTFPLWEGSAQEWTELAGGRDKAKRLTAKLQKQTVLTKTGKARATRYRLDWTLEAGIREELTAGIRLNPEREEGDHYRAPQGMDLGSRAHRVIDRHSKEQLRIQRPLSGEELEIRRRARNTCQWGKRYFDAALEAESPEEHATLSRLGHMYAGASEADWRRWMDAGRPLSEDEVREAMGLPPLPPELEPKTVSPEELKAMLRKVTREPKPVKVKELPPVPVPEDETEDERLLRTMCRGNVKVFENVYGRLPNQERTVTSNVRDEKARRRRERRARVESRA
ncbi:hypothetical protein PO587_02690 [Streptomyces gilvifuscus]|uniref:PE-PGRS family protein n=1 Tax=Streptomyces gilvifuscus TaxID=1550617 RepID=A0ABT5FLH4_9ACTN|nr:hypothetical protein [Streptomyces gilvifuscus]MDC2953358.1 hypothetical protein [Streptomyces gilvifuscus]